MISLCLKLCIQMEDMIFTFPFRMRYLEQNSYQFAFIVVYILMRQNAQNHLSTLNYLYLFTAIKIYTNNCLIFCLNKISNMLFNWLEIEWSRTFCQPSIVYEIFAIDFEMGWFGVSAISDLPIRTTTFYVQQLKWIEWPRVNVRLILIKRHKFRHIQFE